MSSSKNSHAPSCLISGFDIFKQTPIQTSTEKTFYQIYQPLGALNEESVLEFDIPPSENYLDLKHSFIHLDVKVTKDTGGDIADADDVSVVNNFLHSLFQRVDLEVNGVVVSDSTNLYPYRAYVNTLLNYSEQSKNSFLSQVAWEKDDAGEFDPDLTKAFSGSLTSRKTYIEDSKTCELRGRLHLDLFEQPLHLLPHVRLHFKFIRSSPEFSLLVKPVAAGTAASKYKIKFTKAELHIRKIKSTEVLSLTHEKILLKENHLANYSIRRIYCRHFNISNGDSNFVRQDMFQSKRPDVLFLMLVDTDAFNGSFQKNPFNFHHSNVSYLNVQINGQQGVLQPLTPDYTNGKYLECYDTLFSGTNSLFKEWSRIDISRQEYSKGYCIYAFDLSADQSAYDYVKSDHQTGECKVEIKFKSALTSAKTLVCIGMSLGSIEIDSRRNVITNY